MADQILDSISSSGPSPISILNKPPTNRIDAAITAAAESGIPGKQQASKDRRVAHMDANDADKLLSGSQKATLSVMGHLSGGANIVGAKRWERRLVGAKVVTANRMMEEQHKLIVFTRWTMTLM